jgi:cytochrome d ubiquinol oxidase subunit I
MTSLDPVFLSRIQFAFTVSYHIIFPTFNVGLGAWLAFLEGCFVATGNLVYRRLFDFWLKIFAVAFGLGVVSGIVLAFEFGTNWSELSRRTGPIQGPLLGYESYTAFALEASFFGVVIFGRKIVPPIFYFVSCVLVAAGTSLSAFWILVNNSWMQAPVGYEMGPNGIFVPTDWAAIIFSPVVWVRFPHMLMASYVTVAFCVAATGAWYLLRRIDVLEGRLMIRMGLGLATVLMPIQLLFGHFTGDYVHEWQPTKFAAIEGRWHDEQPAAEVLIAWPNEAEQRNDYEIAIPYLGSLIATMTLDSKEVGLTDFPPDQRPPVVIPFFTFRLMVGIGLLMLAIAWGGLALSLLNQLERRRILLWGLFFSFPLGFIATLTGWFTAEVGRQPWTVFGQMLTKDAATPFLTTAQVTASLIVFVLVYTFIFAAGTIYIYRLLRAGFTPTHDLDFSGTNPNRPLSVPGDSPGIDNGHGLESAE